MTITALFRESDFEGSPQVDWTHDRSLTAPIDTGTDAYAATDGMSRVTVLSDAHQSLNPSYCGGLPGTRCSLRPKMALMLADNTMEAPIRVRFSGDGVKAVGAFVIAAGVAWGTPYAPILWARGSNGAYTHLLGNQGVTGDIVRRAGGVMAPFIGASASGMDRITEAYFDATHPSMLSFERLGVSCLYLWT